MPRSMDKSGTTTHNLALLRRATGPADRAVVGCSALAILLLGWQSTLAAPGREAVIHRDNRPLMTLPLDHDRRLTVDGRLGPVAVEVAAGRIRLLEYASPRMIGTRSGWIGDAGEIAVCVPCGILIQVNGQRHDRAASPGHRFDGIAR